MVQDSAVYFTETSSSASPAPVVLQEEGEFTKQFRRSNGVRDQGVGGQDPLSRRGAV